MKTFEILAYNCTKNIYNPSEQIFNKIDDNIFNWAGLNKSLDEINRLPKWYHPYTIKRESDGLVLSIGDILNLHVGSWKIIKFNVFKRNNIENIQIELKHISNSGYKLSNNTILLDTVRRSMIVNPTIIEKVKESKSNMPKLLFTTNDNITVFNKKHPQLYWICKKTLQKGKDEANSLDYLYDPEYYYFKSFKARNEFHKELLEIKKKQKLKANV